MSKYAAMLFDLDGTLLDTLGDLTDGVNYVLSRFYFKCRSKAEVQSFLGNGIPTLLRRALPAECSEELHKKAVQIFSKYYMQNMKKHTRPYEGIYDMLCKLNKQGFKTGVVSNKSHSAVKELCSYFFGDLITAAFGSTTEETRKPSPYLIYSALSALGCEKSKAVFIGDSDVDISAANNAGIDIINVGWGYRNTDFLFKNGAKKVASDPDNLFTLLTILA